MNVCVGVHTSTTNHNAPGHIKIDKLNNYSLRQMLGKGPDKIQLS